MFVSHLYVFLEKYLFISLAHFLIGSFIFLELSCISCLYIFEISCLSVASFAIIFSYSEGCLFTLLIFSFVVPKLLILIRSHLFIFAYLICWTLHSMEEKGEISGKEMYNFNTEQSTVMREP